MTTLCQHMGFPAKGRTDIRTITVRNLDDDVIARLKERARDNDRSLESEVCALLTEVSEQPSKKKFIELANRISATTPRGVEILPSLDVRERAVKTSFSLKHSVYDCFYIAVAEELDVRVVTEDQCLHNVVQDTVFATLFQPLTR